MLINLIVVALISQTPKYDVIKTGISIYSNGVNQERKIGWAGIRFDHMTGLIIKIYPESPLNKYHIVPGDVLISLRGHRPWQIPLELPTNRYAGDTELIVIQHGNKMLRLHIRLVPL